MNGVQQSLQKPALASLLNILSNLLPFPPPLHISFQQNSQIIKRVHKRSESYYQQLLLTLEASYPAGMTESLRRNLRIQCQRYDTEKVHTNLRSDLQALHQATIRVSNELITNPRAQHPNGILEQKMRRFKQNCQREAGVAVEVEGEQVQENGMRRDSLGIEEHQ